jgi:acyl carrier protein
VGQIVLPPKLLRNPYRKSRLLRRDGGLWQRRVRLGVRDGDGRHDSEWLGDAMMVFEQTPDEAALAALIVKTLNLETEAADIDPEAPLFGEGLGLDSIDILEVALAVSQTYGVKLRADDENNTAIFQSLRRLSGEIQARRAG